MVLIIHEAKSTSFSYRRLKAYIFRKYSTLISKNTIKSILKRTKTGRHLYDYESLLPFEKLQLDTKHLIDKSS